MQGVINFAKSYNVKLHKKGTSRLSDDPFDCVPKDFHHYLKTLSDRAMYYQWNDDAFGDIDDTGPPNLANEVHKLPK